MIIQPIKRFLFRTLRSWNYLMCNDVSYDIHYDKLIQYIINNQSNIVYYGRTERTLLFRLGQYVYSFTVDKHPWSIIYLYKLDVYKPIKDLPEDLIDQYVHDNYCVSEKYITFNWYSQFKQVLELNKNPSCKVAIDFYLNVDIDIDNDASMSELKKIKDTIDMIVHS